MSTSSSAQSASSEPHFNIRNPLPLSATQEQQVKEVYYKRVRGYCAPEIKGLHCSPFLPFAPTSSKTKADY
jgi:COX assembly protein 1